MLVLRHSLAARTLSFVLLLAVSAAWFFVPRGKAQLLVTAIATAIAVYAVLDACNSRLTLEPEALAVRDPFRRTRRVPYPEIAALTYVPRSHLEIRPRSAPAVRFPSRTPGAVAFLLALHARVAQNEELEIGGEFPRSG